MSPKRSLKGVKAAWMSQYKKKSFKKKPRAARIKGAIKPREELKFADTVITATAAVGTVYTGVGLVQLLNGIAEGSDYTTRDGRQATMKSVHVRTAVFPAAGSGSGIARTMLIWDNAPNGALAAVTDILESASAASFPKVNNANRFTILRDDFKELSQFSVAATQSYAGGPLCQRVDLFVPLDAVTQFNGTGATIASIQNGALLLLTIGDNGAWSNGQFVARVRYSDD